MARTALIISVSSGIGTAMAHDWIRAGWTVFGTYRTASQDTEDLKKSGARLVQCDLTDATSMASACDSLRQLCPKWDVMTLCPGTMDPIGPFASTDFDAWSQSLHINFTNQLRMVHALLPTRNLHAEHGPCVLFFAGGGTNNATTHYSAYTISKVALIKMCELLDAELPDTRFTIVGPGWVDTKIHDETLRAKERAGNNFQRTQDALAQGNFTPMEDVLTCCNWLIQQPKEIISGRNFSVAYDAWGTDELRDALADDPDLYKLRRHGNTLSIPRPPTFSNKA